jgi:hypothetical protein
MAHGIEDIQPGWKVFAGSDEVGSVKEVGEEELLVSKGLINRHEYHVPADLVEDANEGIVDLKVDLAAVQALQE